MAGLDQILFGYRRISVADEARTAFANLLLSMHVSAHPARGGEYLISERDYRRLSERLAELEVEISPPLGIPSVLLRPFRSRAVAIGLLVGMLLNLVLPSLVWDVRISGNASLAEHTVKQALAECGLEVGVPWGRIDPEDVEYRLLEAIDGIAWVNINRRGSVAYVELVERQGAISIPEVTDTYVNVVSSADCVIDEISVRSGVAQVKVGDTVKKGEVLISGAVKDSEGRVSFCHAEGTVMGRCYGEVSTFVSENEQIIERNEPKLLEVRLNLFKISLNIFKNYGNYEDGCVIIEDKDTFVAFRDRPLPLGITRIYADSGTAINVSYTAEELVSIASFRHGNALRIFLSSSEPLSITTRGEFAEGGYRVTSGIAYSTSIAVEKKIDIPS